MILDSCSSSPNTLFLKGYIDGKNVGKSPVLEVTYVYNSGYYEITDTLAETDKNGAFAFNVRDKQFKYVGILQVDRSLVLYNMETFK